MNPQPALLLEDDLLIPAQVYDLERFRQWSQSEQFPEHGRIDYLDGQVEVDLSPEDIHRHGTLKSEISSELSSLVQKTRLGIVLIDRSRVVSPAAGLSVEPDVVVVFHSTFEAGRVREVPSARGGAGVIELEGAPDLVVEILSDSSEKKDRRRLPPLYAKAGVPELWLADARQEPLAFEIHTLKPGGYALQKADSDGWISSPVLGRQLRLVVSPGPRNRPHYELEHRPV